MKVMVTGGTGFIGAHTVRALVDAGHDVRLLVRRPELLDTVLKPLGVEGVDHVVGDATDPAAVNDALDGCGAVVHAAAVVAIERQRAAEVLATNERATRVVLGAAHERRLDPMVYVSSVSALAPTSAGRLSPDSDVATATGAYGRSKSEAERYARGLQADGAPIVITYPAMVLGPPAGSRRVGSGGDVLASMLKSGFALVTDGVWSIVDVRDVAHVHVAATRAGLGPRRYTAGGHFVRYREVVDMIEGLTGRRFRRLGVPSGPLRIAATFGDIVNRVAPVLPFLSQEAIASLLDAVPVDDTRTLDDLAVTFRDPAATIAATLRGLYDNGEVGAKHLGTLAS
jgi:nucleoside-diphosphate-sugar epimerase